MNSLLVVLCTCIALAASVNPCPSCMHTWPNTSMDDYDECSGGRLTVQSSDECCSECIKNTSTCHMWTYSSTRTSPNCFLDGRGDVAGDGRYYISLRNETGSTAGLLVDMLPYVGSEPPAPLPPKARYIGCFRDLVDGGARDLPWFWCSNGTDSTPMSGVNYCAEDPRLPTGASSWAAAGKMSPTLCSQICSYYRYYGVQEGNKCFCGDTYGYYGNATDGTCNSKCSDPTAEGACGGVLHNSIYENSPPPKDIPTHSLRWSRQEWVPSGLQYVGCFKDQQSPLQINALPVFFCPLGLQYCPGETPVIDGIAMACVEPGSGTNRRCSGLFDSDACARFKGPSAGTLPQLTIEMCDAACTGFQYIGLNNGDRCYCGSEMVISPTAFANATKDKCSSPCPGNKAQSCGGHAIDGSGRFTSVYVRSGTDVNIRVRDGTPPLNKALPPVLAVAERAPDLLPAVPTVTATTVFEFSTDRIKRQKWQTHDGAIAHSHVKGGEPTVVAICRSHPCTDPPAELDWEKKGGVVTPVKDQGTSCNASWAFAAVAAIESANALSTGRLFSLSEQELLDCGWSFGLQSCRGGSINRAFRYVASTGLSTQDTYPYSGAPNRCCGSAQAYTGIPSQEGQGMQAFCDLPPMNESELVGALQFQPVAVGMAVDQEFMDYKGGILRSKVGSKDGRPMNHAALIVGYTPSYWRVKNSFGAQWGENGYARIARGVGGAGQYAILTAPSYPAVISPRKIYPKPVKPHNYDKPPCKAGEVELAVAGLSNRICTHACSPTQQCPGNPGKGSDAQIQCAFEDPKTGNKYCALICEHDCDCAQAPVALTCQKSPDLSFSICMAPASSK